MWEATTNSGVALETVAKEIAAYQTSGTFEADYSHFCTLLQIRQHPCLCKPVATDQAADTAAAEVEKKPSLGEKPPEMVCSVRNHVLDAGTMGALTCCLPLSAALTSLVLYNAALAPSALDALAAALPRSHLKKLQLEYNPLHDAAPFAKLLAENSPLQTLSLRGNKLGDAGAAEVARALAKNTWLLSLNLFDNDIGDEGATLLVSKLRFNVMLKTLSLSNNRVGDATARALTQTLAGYELVEGATADEHAAAVGRLAELNRTILAGKKGKKAGHEPGAPNTSELPHLPPAHPHEGASWARGNEHLQAVNLSNNRVTSEGATACAEILRQRKDTLGFELSIALREVCFARNQISDEAGAELATLANGKILLSY